ncbi:MAG: TIGR03118 family protein [Alphaproteobacteria bacterium]|nr:TIGR03118 family protein [Alphaproteobacteria bacterium]
MKLITHRLARASLIAIGVAAAASAGPEHGQAQSQSQSQGQSQGQNQSQGQGQGQNQNSYTVTNLTSDMPGVAPNTDPVLQNAWGVAFAPGGAFWIADNQTGCSTLYDGTGAVVPLQFKIPLPGGVIPPTACVNNNPQSPSNPTPAAPTGLVWNATTTFVVPGTNTPAVFIFDTEDGTISAWAPGLNPPDQAVLAVDNSSNAVYKGLAFGTNPQGVFLFAANFKAGTVDAFAPNGSNGFQSATPAQIPGGFTDPNIPAGFAPFGIQNIDGDLFVTYAQQDAAKANDVPGQGAGFVDVFDTSGNLLQRFAQHGLLNAPWGVARASFAFGRFSGDILVGNFGDGLINVFDSAGNFVDTLKDSTGKSIVIPGLWTLTLGGGSKSTSDTVYFTAGPNDEADGLFGTITPASSGQ